MPDRKVGLFLYLDLHAQQRAEGYSLQASAAERPVDVWRWAVTLSEAKGCKSYTSHKWLRNIQVQIPDKVGNDIGKERLHRPVKRDLQRVCDN